MSIGADNLYFICNSTIDQLSSVCEGRTVGVDHGGQPGFVRLIGYWRHDIEVSIYLGRCVFFEHLRDINKTLKEEVRAIFWDPQQSSVLSGTSTISSYLGHVGVATDSNLNPRLRRRVSSLQGDDHDKVSIQRG